MKEIDERSRTYQSYLERSREKIVECLTLSKNVQLQKIEIEAKKLFDRLNRYMKIN